MNYGYLSHDSRRPQRRFFGEIAERSGRGMSAATRDPVAEALYCIVQEKGLKQKKVAERAGLKYQDLNRTLHGRRPLLARELPALAAACGVTVTEVYERAEGLRPLMQADEERGQGGPA